MPCCVRVKRQCGQSAVEEFTATESAASGGAATSATLSVSIARACVTLADVSGGLAPADIDPFGGDQFGHARRCDPDRAVDGAGRRNHFVECFQRHVAVD